MTTPVLTGKHVRLEPLRMEHLPLLEEVAYDDSIWRYMVAGVRTPSELRTWAETALAASAAGTTQVWVTVPMELNRPIGSSRFADIDLTHRTAELGYTWLAPGYRGTGLNTEVKLLQLTHAFETLQLRRVAFKIHHENLRSQAAVRKLGARHEGTFRNHYIMPDGSTRHSVWFSILDSEWPEVKIRLHANLDPARQPNVE